MVKGYLYKRCSMVYKLIQRNYSGFSSFCFGKMFVEFIFIIIFVNLIEGNVN